jgi:uncharacterized protein (TIGR02099 family)
LSRLKTLLLAVVIAWGLLAVLVRATTPLLAEYRGELESIASERLGLPVSIGAVKARWYGLRPLIELDQVRLGIQPRDLRIRRAQIDLDPGQLLIGALPDALRITVEGVDLTAVRDADGRISVTGGSTAGIDQPLRPASLPAHLRLVDTRLVWVDRALARPPLPLEHVDIQVDRVADEVRVRAGLQTEAGEASLAAHLSGTFDTGDWRGSSYLQVRGLDLARLLGGYLGAGLAANDLYLDAHAWTQWQAARPAHTQGGFSLREIPPDNEAGPGKSMAASFSLMRQSSGLRLGLQDLDVELEGQRWPRATLAVAVDQDGDKKRIDVAASYLRIDDIAPLVDALPERLFEKPTRLPAGFSPRGEIHDLRLTATTDRDGLDWRARARFDGLTMAPHGDIPGVDNLAGHFLGASDRVQLSLDSRNTTLRFVDLFRNPLHLEHLEGQLDIVNRQDGWSMYAKQLQARTPHLATRSRLRLEKRVDQPLFIDLQTDFEEGDAAHASLYYPAAIMGEQLVAWLDRSILSGRVVEGTALVYGPVDDFAFERTRSGVFQVVFDAEDVVIDYREGWPRLGSLDARVKFHGNQLDISRASGSVYDSRVSQLEAHIASLEPASPVRIRGEVLGPLQNKLRVLAEPALSARFGEFAELLRGQGESRLALDFSVPLGNIGKTTLAGSLEFAGNTLAMPEYDFSLRDIAGRLDFDLDGLRAKGIRARALDAPLQLDVAPLRDGTTNVRATGRLATAAIARQLDELPLEAAQGSAGFTVEVDVPPRSESARRASVLKVHSDLEGIAVTLPPPFGKTAKTRRSLVVSMPLGDGGGPGSLRYGETLHALFNAGGQRIGLQLGGGTAQVPTTAGLRLRGELGEVDIAAWRQALANLPMTEAAGMPVDAQLGIDRLSFPGGVFDKLQVRLTGDAETWRGTVAAAAVEGRFEAPRGSDGRAIAVKLTRLFLPMPESQEAGGPPDPTSGPDPSTLPGLDLAIDDFRLADAQLGRLDLRTRPADAGLALTRLTLGDGALQLDATGSWRRETTGLRTRVQGTAKSADIGDLLADLGYTRQLDDAAAEASFSLTWPGAPMQVHRATLGGELELAIGPGRLVEVDPGVTRVIGLINLNALTRRLRLDFNDIFRKGYSFDSIDGSFAFTDGIATTADLRMAGPSGRLRIEGSTDLVAETLDQQVIVIPKLDATLPIAGTIAGGPVAGLAVLVAQQVLPGRVDQIYRFDYAISGPWADPTIELQDSGGTLSQLLKPLRELGAASDSATVEPPPQSPPPPAPSPAPSPSATPPPEPQAPAPTENAAAVQQDDQGPVATVVSRARAGVDRAVRKLLDLFDKSATDEGAPADE